jgi:hypothetical protein
MTFSIRRFQEAAPSPDHTGFILKYGAPHNEIKGAIVRCTNEDMSLERGLAEDGGRAGEEGHVTELQGRARDVAFRCGGLASQILWPRSERRLLCVVAAPMSCLRPLLPIALAAVALGYLAAMVLTGAQPVHRQRVAFEAKGVLATPPERIRRVEISRGAERVSRWRSRCPG